MSCIWNGNLHGWKVNRSNRHSQKQFLHLGHWIQPPKSRECDKHICSVVRLRFGPVAPSLNSLIDLFWRTIATSHSTTTTCAQLIAIQDTTKLSPLKKHVHMACTKRSMDTCHLLLFISLDPSSTIQTHSCCYFQLPMYTSEEYVHSIILWFNSPWFFIMDATHYWSFAREYST